MIIEEYFELHYKTDFTFKKHMLIVEIDEKGHVDKDLDYKRKGQKELEKLITALLELILINQILMIMKNLVQ